MPTHSPARADPGLDEHKFPAPRFPAGVAVPPTVLLVVLLVAAVSLLGLRSPTTEAGSGIDPAGWPGLVPGLAVAAGGVGVFLILWVLVVRPVQRLHGGVAAAYSGGGGSIHRSGIREVDRVAVALRAHGARTGHAKARTRRRLPLTVCLTVVTVALVGWLGTAFAVVSSGHSAAAESVVTDGRQNAAGAAADLRHELQEGLSGLQAIASSTPSTSIGDLRTAAAGVLAVRPIFRAVHVVNRDGGPVTSIGSELSLTGPPAAGVTQLNSSGPEPIVVASAPMGDGTHTLVAEYDVRALNTVLDRSGAPIRVLDSDLRTVLSSDGYQAFTELTDPVLRDAATTAFEEGPTSTTQVVDGVPSTVAGHRVGFNDAAAALNWVVLQNQSLGAARFAQDPIDRTAVVIIGLSVSAALLVMAWIHVAAVRPMRRLGDHAEAIAGMLDGGPAPEPVAPQRIDEVGAIAAGLNRFLVVVTRAPLEATQILPSVRLRPAIPRQSAVPSSWNPSPRPRLRPPQLRPGHHPEPVGVLTRHATGQYLMAHAGST